MQRNARFASSPAASETSSFEAAPTTAQTSVDASPNLSAVLADDSDDETRVEVDSNRIAQLLSLASSVSDGSAAEDQSYGLLHKLFEAQVSLTPKKICLQQGSDRFVTYQQLDKLAEQGATGLRAMGITPGSLVPVCYAKSVDMIVGMLSILKSGGAYVPIAPAHPQARKQAIIEQVRPKVTLATKSDAPELEFPGSEVIDVQQIVTSNTSLQPAHKRQKQDRSPSTTTTTADEQNDVAPVDPSSLAYVIFTSGTTGTPKGVMIEHQNVYAYIKNYQGSAKSDQHSRRLSFASFIFDASIGDIFGTLTSGATLVLDTSESLVATLASALHEYNITHICLTPSVASFASKSLADLTWLHTLFLGGEACTRELVDSLPHVDVHMNVYGPSEATVEVTQYDNNVSPSYKAGTMPIGRPIGHCQVYILQRDGLSLMQIGAVGEICVGGPQIGRGYLNDEAKTTAKFVADPFVKGGRMFRTGDLGRLHPDGQVECLGRIDGQVKIRGLRIETGEVESAITADKTVDQAKVVKMTLADNVDRLVGFLTLESNEDLEDSQKGPLAPFTLEEELATQLWSEMEHRLPTYMLPFLLVRVPSFPITQNGKLDERKLVATISELHWTEQAAFSQTATAGQDATEKAEPENETQAKLRTMWANVLQLQESAIGIDDSFYRLGGDSITAVRLLVKCREAGFNLRISDLNNTSTIRSQAQRGGSGAAAGGNLLVKEDQEISDWLDTKSVERLTSTVLPSVGLELSEVDDVAPASPLQRGLIAETMQSQDGTAYVTWRITKFQEEIDAEALRAAVVQVIKETPIYRTRFALDAQLGVIQIVLNDTYAEELVSPVILVPGEADIDSAAELVAQGNTWGQPTTSPLHVSILASPEGEARMVWIAHHALSDGWSVGEMQKRLRVLYSEALQDISAIQPKQSPPFARVAHHLRQRDTAEDLEFWKSYMDGAEALQLGSRTGPMAENRVQSKVSASVIANIDTCSRNVGVPPSTIFLYALAVGLRLLTDQEDLSFGLILSGRTLPVSGIERVIGPCINTTICRVMLNDSQSVREALQKFQANLDDVNERGYIGLTDIGGAARIDASAIAHTLAEYRNLPEEIKALHGSAGQHHPFDGMDVYGDDRFSAPMIVSGGPDRSGALKVNLTADSWYLSEVDARWLVRHICNIVSWICDTEGQKQLQVLDIVDDVQLDAIMEWSVHPDHLDSSEPAQTEQELEDVREAATAHSLQALFRQRVARHPKKIAVQYGTNDFMTYEDLDKASDAVAGALRANGVETGSVVPICMAKSVLSVVATYAVLKAGAGYAPLDPANPADRKTRIIGQCAAKVVVIDDTWKPDEVDVGASVPVHIQTLLSQAGKGQPLEHDADLRGELAYVIFTSGSTGLPKGVMIEHEQILAFIRSQEGLAGETKYGRRLNFSSTAFDASVGDIFGTLSHSATLVMAPTADLLQDLDKELTKLAVTNIFLTPSFAAPMATSRRTASYAWTTRLLLGGEAVASDLRDNLCHRFVLENVYGPTETTIQTLAHIFPNQRSEQQAYVPIGYPVGETKIYVLDPDSNKVLPVGAIGELCIGGPQVARGYLNDEAKTKAKFVADPFVKGGRMFRSGDLGRLHGDGLFECRGRIDGQIKIRGLRIETGEVEAAITSDERIDQAKVVKMRLADEIDRLVSFVLMESDEQGNQDDVALEASPLDSDLANQLWANMESKLPAYMLPFLLVRVNIFPITQNGKLDERRLRATIAELEWAEQAAFSQTAASGDEDSGKSEPENDTQSALRSLWAKVLQLEEGSIGIDDTFYLSLFVVVLDP